MVNLKLDPKHNRENVVDDDDDDDDDDEKYCSDTCR